MSKPWFLKIAMEQEPSPLAATITQLLSKKENPKEAHTTPEALATIRTPTPASH